MTQLDKEAQVNKFSPDEIKALPMAERAPWEVAMLKESIAALNSNPANNDKAIQVAPMSASSGSYAVSFHKDTDTIQLIDAKDGQRGIIYQAARGATPTINAFRPDEQQSFLDQHSARAATFDQPKHIKTLIYMVRRLEKLAENQAMKKKPNKRKQDEKLVMAIDF